MKLSLLAACVICAIVLSSCVPAAAVASGTADAVITSATITPKVYDGGTLVFNLTAHDYFIPGNASLYFVMYLDGTAAYTSSELLANSPYSPEVSWQANISAPPPGLHGVFFYLYWDNETSSVYEDISGPYLVFVVSLRVSGWSAQPLSVQAGRTAPYFLNVSFTNGGNDVMYGTNETVTGSGGLVVSLVSQAAGDLPVGGNASFSYNVTVPPDMSPGLYLVRFVVSYSDFEGSPYTLYETASVYVVTLSSSLSLTSPASAKIGETITISASLTDGNGNPVAGQPVRFSLGYIDLGTALTDDSGNAAKTFFLNVAAGSNYTIYGSFSGTPSIGSARATSSISVNPLTLTITSSVASAQLLTVDGAPVSTDASGKAIVMISQLGNHSVQVLSPYVVAPGQRAVFVQWADGETSSFRTVSMNSDRSLTFVSKSQFFLSVSSPQGLSAIGTGWYDSYTAATVTAPRIWNVSSGASRGSLVSCTLDGSQSLPVIRSGNGTFSVNVSMAAPHSVTLGGIVQYYLDVKGGGSVTLGTPSPTGDSWFDTGASTTVSSSYVWNVGPLNRTRLTGWSLDGGPSTLISFKDSGTFTSPSVSITGPHTLAFLSTVQFFVSVTSDYGSVQGTGWYDGESTATISVSMAQIDHGNSTRHVFKGWNAANNSASLSYSQVVTQPENLVATWKTQYYLNVSSPYGTASGSGWYDSGSTVSISLDSTELPAGFLAYHRFNGWSGSYTGTDASATAAVAGPENIVAVWSTDSTLQLLLLAGVAVVLIFLMWMVLRRARRASGDSGAPPESPLSGKGQL